MRNGKIIAGLLTISLLLGCGTPESDARKAVAPPQSDDGSVDRTPESDARKAVAAGDRRLVGYMGIGLVVPGTPPGFQVATYKPGVRVLTGITDTSSSSEIEKAQVYCTRCNRVVLDAAR
jgi:hypothetical protein